MKKILFLLVIILLSIQSINVDANWYGNHAVSYTNPWSSALSTVNWWWPNLWTLCNADSDPTWDDLVLSQPPQFYWWTRRPYAVALNNNATTLNIHSDSEMVIATSWTIRCLYWDHYNPEALTISYNVWWTNAAQTITVSAKDRWGSKLKKMVLQQSDNWWAWTTVATWDNLPGATNTLVTRSWVRNPVHAHNYNYKLIAYDYAWNNFSLVNPNLIRFDTVPPNSWDIVNNNPANLEADDAYSYNISITNSDWSLGLSPIEHIVWWRENINNQSIQSFTDSTFPWNQTWDISKVDNFRNINWNTARQYTFQITQICDEAWNCWNWTQTYLHDVYANSSRMTNFWAYVNSKKEVLIGDKNNLEDFNNIADGTVYPLNITLKDRYWNAIIPATWIRTVDFNFNVTNNSQMNQYLLDNTDAVFLNIPSNASYLNRLTNDSSFNSQTSPTNNWVYPINFKIYAPTSFAWWNKHSIWTFNIDSITFDVNNVPANFIDVANDSISNSTIEFKFDPIYTATFSWEQSTYWLIEWAIQNWSINISKNWASSPGSRKLYLEFGSWATNSTSSDFDLSASWWTRLFTSWTIWEWHNSLLWDKLYYNNFPNWVATLQTKINSATGSVASITNHYLSTHISYSLDWHNVFYNWEVIWKDLYFDLIFNVGTTTVWLKIDGKASTENYNEILAWQENSDVKIIWELTKSKLSAEFRAQVYSFIKSLSVVSTSSSAITDLTTADWKTAWNWWKIVDNWKVLYYWLFWWWEIVLWNWVNDEQVSWKKTIIINWWNLYIRSNMYYANKSTDILWIIVLQDDNWNGWNVYIDPDVTNIVWTIYADKAILNYNWTSEINWYTNQSLLKNQIHIYGSLFTSNTIWWARENPPVCPYYTRSYLTCNLETAQQYDLNYLRRYFTFVTPSWGIAPANNWKAAWWSTFNQSNWNYNLDWNASYEKNIISNLDPYFKYPVIIEYNPLIQLEQPPIFRMN